MKKIILVATILASLSGCAGIKKQPPICSANAIVGGQETTVSIYGVRKNAGHTQYKAGYPFNWKWVNKNNFTTDTCH